MYVFALSFLPTVPRLIAIGTVLPKNDAPYDLDRLLSVWPVYSDAA